MEPHLENRSNYLSPRAKLASSEMDSRQGHCPTRRRLYLMNKYDALRVIKLHRSQPEPYLTSYFIIFHLISLVVKLCPG